LIELGHLQGPQALALALATGRPAKLHKDFAGLERVLEVSN
jgi:hypothetical protein